VSKHKEVPKKISARKLAANQENAQKSTGPSNTISTRYNATKHGLLSEGVTELDNPEKFQSLAAQLKKELKPVGILEHECVHQIAVLTLRIRRVRLLEAEAFTAHLNPATTVDHPGTLTAVDPDLFGRIEILDIGLPAQVSNDAIDRINRTVLRYETSIENKLFRWQNQLERLQRLRHGEKIPAPANVELNVHTAGEMASFGNSPHA
jgi:hypothetical protein